MKKTLILLCLSLVLLGAAIFGLSLREKPQTIAGSDTVEKANTVVGEYYIQSGSTIMLLGDIDDDGKLTTTDARLVLQIAAHKYLGEFGEESLLKYEFLTADVDQNDKINTTDARLLLQAAAKKLKEFPDRTTTTTVGTTTTAPTRKESTLSTETVELAKATNAVVNEDPDTFCNPVNIAYAYQSDADNGYREGADPVIQVFDGEYYLFVSHSFGYWWSENLRDWHFVNCTAAEMDKWAPATCVVDGVMYLTHSQGGAIFKSTDPKSGQWENVGRPVVWEDPALLYDDDGFVYCYYGCSPVDPLFMVKLDPTDNMSLVEGPFECFYTNQPAHGFENGGDNNTNHDSSYLEGAWVVKYEGKYYYNYAVPGTDRNYANGCYVSDNAMGPFTFCESSPFTFKPTGFVRGCGHGAVFQDLWGNWWCVETATISQNAMWERRVVLVPVSFDKNGEQIADTLFLDYPMYVPALIENNFGDQAQPDWNLLSYGAKVSSSSDYSRARAASYAVDENFQSWWSAASGDVGEWLMLDLGKLCRVNAVQVNFADQSANAMAGRNNNFCYNYLVEFSQDGETWYTLADHTGITAKPYDAIDTSHDYYELVSAIGARYIRVTNKGDIPNHGKFAISGLRVFGSGGGEAPAQVTDFTVTRNAKDERGVTIQWTAAEGAQNYVVRYGYDKDVLNQAYHVYDATELTINALNMGVDYWFTVDSFNDSGYTKGTEVKAAPATVPAPAPKPVKEPVRIQYILEGLPIYEAESATLGNGASKSHATEDAKASGGGAVHNFHMEGAYFEVSGVDGGKGGTATLHLGYSTGNTAATAEILVNGKSMGRFDTPNTASWSRFVAIDIPITDLNPGTDNVIRVVGGTGGGFNADFIQISFD